MLSRVAGLLVVGVVTQAAVAVRQEASPGEDSVRIVIFGDSGAGGPDQKAVARQLRRVEDDVRYVFLLGDNVYFKGQAGRFEDAFLRPYERFLERRTETGERQIAFHAALGNHDVRTCSLAPRADGSLPPDKDAYDWREPGCDVEQQLAEPAFGYVDQRRYYDVDVRGSTGGLLAEVFVLDSNTLPSTRHADRTDVEQMTWWRRELQSSRERARRDALQPWRIVLMHHPARTPSARGYFLGFGGHAEDPALLEALSRALTGKKGESGQILERQIEPTLATGAIDAVFAGHNHFYARLVPGEDNVRQFVSGGGGVSVLEPDLDSVPTAVGGGFHHFVTAVLTRTRFEYCVIDSLGRVRDHGFWRKDAPQEPDQPLDEERYRAVCRP